MIWHLESRRAPGSHKVQSHMAACLPSIPYAVDDLGFEVLLLLPGPLPPSLTFSLSHIVCVCLSLSKSTINDSPRFQCRLVCSLSVLPPSILPSLFLLPVRQFYLPSFCFSSGSLSSEERALHKTRRGSSCFLKFCFLTGALLPPSCFNHRFLALLPEIRSSPFDAVFPLFSNGFHSTQMQHLS
jgi:hypothetical protein